MGERDAATVLDEYLVIRTQQGDGAAFRLLVEKWQTRFLAHAYQVTRDTDAAHDIVQEGWLAIVRGLASLNDPARFRPWAYRILANKARDWIRREQVRRRAAQATPVEEGVTTHAADAVAQVRAGMEKLDPEQRLILTWFYLEEMTVQEIAEVLSIPAGTVKSRLFHARQSLRARLEEEL